MKKGERYTSKVWLHPETGAPLVMLITRIAQGVVYYRPDYGTHDDGSRWLGSSAYFTFESAAKYLGSKVS